MLAYSDTISLLACFLQLNTIHRTDSSVMTVAPLGNCVSLTSTVSESEMGENNFLSCCFQDHETETETGENTVLPIAECSHKLRMIG